MSMQDRIDMYNRDLEDQDLEDAGNMEGAEKVRRISVVFGGAQEAEETTGPSPSTEVEVHQVRERRDELSFDEMR